MTARTKTALYGFFEYGDQPSNSNFADLIDTIGGPPIVVAASDASDVAKGRADYVCDGTADDVQINAAITAGPTLITNGTFVLAASLSFPTKGAMFGLGWGSRIEAANGMNDDMIILDSVDVSQVMLADFSLYGNSTNQTSGHGIYFNNTGRTPDSELGDCHHYISHVLSMYTKETGIYLLGDCRGSWIRNCRVRKADASGIIIQSADCKISDSDIGNLGEYGLRLSGNEIFAMNCKVFGAGDLVAANGIGIYANTAGCQLINCQAEENTRQGYSITANNIVLSNCVANDNGETTARRPGFYVAADYITMMGCYAYDSQAGENRTQNYGVQLASGSDYLRINCTTYNNYSGSLDDQGATNLTNEIVAW